MRVFQSDLWLDDLQLSAISSEVLQRTDLKRLSCYKNNLDYIPEALFELKNLET